MIAILLYKCQTCNPHNISNHFALQNVSYKVIFVCPCLTQLPSIHQCFVQSYHFPSGYTCSWYNYATNMNLSASLSQIICMFNGSLIYDRFITTLVLWEYHVKLQCVCSGYCCSLLYLISIYKGCSVKLEKMISNCTMLDKTHILYDKTSLHIIIDDKVCHWWKYFTKYA